MRFLVLHALEEPYKLESFHLTKISAPMRIKCIGKSRNAHQPALQWAPILKLVAQQNTSSFQSVPMRLINVNRLQPQPFIILRS